MYLWDAVRFLFTGRATVIDPYVGYIQVVYPWAFRWHVLSQTFPRPWRRRQEIEMPPYEGADDTEGWEIPEEWFSDPELRWTEEDEDGRPAS